MVADKDIQFLQSPINEKEAIEIAKRYGGGSGSSNVQSQNFTNQTSVTVTHNLGYKPLVQVSDENGNIIDVVINHTNTSSFVMNSNISITGVIIYC